MTPIPQLFYVLMFLVVFLPSGKLLGFPIKIALSLLLIVLLFTRPTRIKLDDDSLSMLALVGVMSLWSGMSLANGYYDGLVTFSRSLFSFLCILLVSRVLIKSNIVSIEQTMKVLWAGAIALFVGKMLIEALVISGMLSVSRVDWLFVSVLNAQYTKLQIPVGLVSLFRIMTANDVVLLVLYSIDLAFAERKPTTKALMVLLVFLYSLVVYSRVTLAQYFVVTVAGLCIYLRGRQVRVGVILVAIVIVAGVVLASGYLFESMQTVFGTRFTGAQVEYSDSFRTEQIDVLAKGIAESPIWGHGLGSYLKDLIRSTTNPHSYEVEYMALIYQFGIVGFFVTVVPLVLLSFKVSIGKIGTSSLTIMLGLNFLIWAIKPCFNPSLLASSSSAVIVALMVARYYYGDTVRASDRKARWLLSER